MSCWTLIWLNGGSAFLSSDKLVIRRALTCLPLNLTMVGLDESALFLPSLFISTMSPDSNSAQWPQMSRIISRSCLLHSTLRLLLASGTLNMMTLFSRSLCSFISFVALSTICCSVSLVMGKEGWAGVGASRRPFPMAVSLSSSSTTCSFNFVTSA